MLRGTKEKVVVTSTQRYQPQNSPLGCEVLRHTERVRTRETETSFKTSEFRHYWQDWEARASREGEKDYILEQRMQFGGSS